MKTYHPQKKTVDGNDLKRRVYHPKKNSLQDELSRRVKENIDFSLWVYFALGVAFCAANIK